MSYKYRKGYGPGFDILVTTEASAIKGVCFPFSDEMKYQSKMEKYARKFDCNMYSAKSGTWSVFTHIVEMGAASFGWFLTKEKVKGSIEIGTGWFKKVRVQSLDEVEGILKKCGINKINIDYMSEFTSICDCWNHEYTTAAVIGATLEEVVDVAKLYAEEKSYYGFSGCFNNGEENDGVVTFTAYREDPDCIAAFFSKHLPEHVVYADVNWDHHEVCVMKNGEEYLGFTARWQEKEPEGYTEEWEEDDEDATIYYDCDVVLRDNETGYEFNTGGGMCEEEYYKYFQKLIKDSKIREKKTEKIA